MKVILQSKEIPKDSIVSKINGEKKYKIIDSLQVYGDKEKRFILEPSNSSRYLIPVQDANGINIVSNEAELVWYIDEKELREFLIRREYQRETK